MCRVQAESIKLSPRESVGGSLDLDLDSIQSRSGSDTIQSISDRWNPEGVSGAIRIQQATAAGVCREQSGSGAGFDPRSDSDAMQSDRDLMGGICNTSNAL